VHGFADVGGLVSGEHAWLRLPDGRVWDPTENVYATTQEFEAACHPLPVRDYTRLQAARLSLWHQHCGPWYNDKTRRQAALQFWAGVRKRLQDDSQ
jgi:hypothetical protein